MCNEFRPKLLLTVPKRQRFTIQVANAASAGRNPGLGFTLQYVRGEPSGRPSAQISSALCLLFPRLTWICASSVCQAALYSSVNKANGALKGEDKEHDYSSIAEIKGLVTSSSSDLYATVRDIYSQPEQAEEPVSDATDPGYETIRIPKTSSSEDDRKAEDGEDGAKAEPDYESVGEVGLTREMSRL